MADVMLTERWKRLADEALPGYYHATRVRMAGWMCATIGSVCFVAIVAGSDGDFERFPPLLKVVTLCSLASAVGGLLLLRSRAGQSISGLRDELLGSYAGEIAEAPDGPPPAEECYQAYRDYLRRCGAWTLIAPRRVFRNRLGLAEDEETQERREQRVRASRRGEWIVGGCTVAFAALVSPFDNLLVRGCAVLGLWFAVTRLYRAGERRDEDDAPVEPAALSTTRRYLAILHDVLFFCCLYLTVGFSIDNLFITHVSDWQVIFAGYVWTFIVCPRRYRAVAYAVLLGYTAPLRQGRSGARR